MQPILQIPNLVPDSVVLKEQVAEKLNNADSAIKNMNSAWDSVHSFQDLGDIVTGQNPVAKDAIAALIDLTVAFIPKLIGALLVLWIGFRLIKILKNAIIRSMERRKTEASLRTFLASFVDLLLKILLIIMVMDIIGIKATSFIAVLGAAGLAIGMALQGTLQNFAGGVIILLMKPFRVGDYIECGGYKGYVKEIRIFHTFIRPFNGRIIIVPNSELATKSLTNHTLQNKIRQEVVVSVAYGSNTKQVKDVLYALIKDYQQRKGKDGQPLILDEEGFRASITLTNLNESSIDFTIYMWNTIANYWDVWDTIREDIYNTLNDNHIEIPFPQIQLHIDQESGANMNIPNTITLQQKKNSESQRY